MCDLKEGLACCSILRDPDGVVVRDVGMALDRLGREGPVVEDAGVVRRHGVAVAVGAAGLEPDDDGDVSGRRLCSLERALSRCGVVKEYCITGVTNRSVDLHQQSIPSCHLFIFRWGGDDDLLRDGGGGKGEEHEASLHDVSERLEYLSLKTSRGQVLHHS